MMMIWTILMVKLSHLLKFSFNGDLTRIIDVLNQFQVPPKPSTSGTQQTSSSSSGKAASKPEELSDDFAADLAAGMEEMLKSLSMGTPGAPGTTDANLSNEEKQLRQLWEQMLEDGMDGKVDSKSGDQLDTLLAEAFKAPAPGGSKSYQSPTYGPQPPPSKSTETENSFQNAIKQAMDKLKSSDETLNVSHHYHKRRKLMGIY